MTYLCLILCAIFFTVSVFLIAKFAIKKKETSEYVSDENYFNDQKG